MLTFECQSLEMFLFDMFYFCVVGKCWFCVCFVEG